MSNTYFHMTDRNGTKVSLTAFVGSEGNRNMVQLTLVGRCMSGEVALDAQLTQEQATMLMCALGERLSGRVTATGAETSAFVTGVSINASVAGKARIYGQGDRYIDNCPDCGEELYFANWANYTDRCMKCGKFFVCEINTREISEEEYYRIKKEGEEEEEN
jgi:hypothetical protein